MNASEPELSSDEALDRFYAALLEDDPVELYERAPCGYLSTTPDGTIVKVNGTFLTWTGYERADLVGRRTFAELLSPGGRIYHETHYAPMLQMQGVAKEIALEIVRADGTRLPVLVNSVLERDAGDRVAVVRAALFDATDRREYERELLRAKQRAEASERQAILLARTLQQTLIPPAPPAIDGLDVTAAYRPAGDGSEVGGDFYDVFQVDDDDWVLAVGDVRGKGVDAAVVTALVRYAIRAAAVPHPAPADVLAHVNAVLLRDATDRFCTALVARLRRSGGRWRATVACGGHPLPVLRRGGERPCFVGRPGTLLGVFPEVALHETEIDLRAGDALVLYTDGIVEARAGREFYGDDRLLQVVDVHRDAPDSAAMIVEDVLEFQGGVARDDAVVVAAVVS